MGAQENGIGNLLKLFAVTQNKKTKKQPQTTINQQHGMLLRNWMPPPIYIRHVFASYHSRREVQKRRGATCTMVEQQQSQHPKSTGGAIEVMGKWLLARPSKNQRGSYIFNGDRDCIVTYTVFSPQHGAPCMLTGHVTVVTEDLWSRYQCTIYCTFYMPGVSTSRFFYIGGLSSRWPWPHNGLSCMVTGPVTVVTEDLLWRYQCTVHCTFHMPGVLTSRFFYIGGLSTRWPWPHNGLSQW